MINEVVNSNSLEVYIDEHFEGDVIALYSLPPTFVRDRCGVDVETGYGAVTIVWEFDGGDMSSSRFSMCVIDGCSSCFKRQYRAIFPQKYTKLDGINEVESAIEKLLLIRC